MNSPSVKRIIRLRFRRLRRYFHPIANSYDEKAIHDFRVEFKRLRAFLRLLSADAAHKSIKIPDSLHKMYQAAGVVRDLQLLQKRVQKEATQNDQPTGYLHWLRRELTAAKGDLDQLWKRETIDKAQKKIEGKVKSDYADNAPGIFVSKKVEDVRVLLTHKIIRDADLHGTRKLVKDIVYNAGIFRKELHTPFAWKGWTDQREESFNKLADQLGKFQDVCTLLIYLKPPEGRPLSQKDKTVLGQLRKTQLTRRRTLKKDLLEKLNRKLGDPRS